MADITYRPLRTEDVKAISRLHLQSLQDGLLYDIGEKYTQIFYTVGLRSGNCFGFAAVNNEDQIVGAAVSTKNITSLFARLLFHPVFAFGLSQRLFRLRKLYPSGGKKVPIKQEFILFFVDPRYRNLYIALRLMQLIDEAYAAMGVNQYSLEVKENNKTANLVYQHFGFTRMYEVGEGADKRIFYVKKPGNPAELNSSK